MIAISDKYDQEDGKTFLLGACVKRSCIAAIVDHQKKLEWLDCSNMDIDTSQPHIYLSLD